MAFLGPTGIFLVAVFEVEKFLSLQHKHFHSWPILGLKSSKNRDFTANGKERVALEWRWDPPERPGVIPPISSLITVNGGKTTAFCSDCQWPPN